MGRESDTTGLHSVWESAPQALQADQVQEDTMAEITAALVKHLREKTGVGMMDCKKALVETNGDIEAAVDWLREKGILKAAKKADRIAAEGLIGVASSGNAAALVELNSETDFVARNDDFQKAVRGDRGYRPQERWRRHEGAARRLAGRPGHGQRDAAAPRRHHRREHDAAPRRRRCPSTKAWSRPTSTTWPATASARSACWSRWNRTGDKSRLKDIGRKVAMHIASMKPLAATTADLDPKVVEKEKAILTAQAAESGKPANVIEKMVEGRIRKFFRNPCWSSRPS